MTQNVHAPLMTHRWQQFHIPTSIAPEKFELEPNVIAEKDQPNRHRKESNLTKSSKYGPFLCTPQISSDWLWYVSLTLGLFYAQPKAGMASGLSLRPHDHYSMKLYFISNSSKKNPYFDHEPRWLEPWLYKYMHIHVETDDFVLSSFMSLKQSLTL